MPEDPGAPASTPRPDQPDLIDVWRAAMADLRDAAARAPWRAPSLLPGWTVADIVAHALWIEASQLGRVDPPHEPDWTALPHVTSPFSRITEVPVDLRRLRSREEVLAEFDVTIADREAALRTARATDPDGRYRTPLGSMSTLEDLLSMRIFDTWVHEQDIRLAVDDPGHLDTPAAHVAAARMRSSLGRVWAKAVDAPVGATVAVTCTGPGVTFSDTVVRSADGRARACDPVEAPTVALTMSFPAYVSLACGRGTAPVESAGDLELAARTIARFNIAP
ncbi:MAG: maleylpyruvate isomerase family mycothiol-dependent enzyme [Candidatus Nanopelagicales bacterium]